MNKILVIIGPTAVGKSSLGINIAKELDGEIISADSMQIYKKLNIGTAKITEGEMCDIKHHLIDIKEISDSYSVQEYVIDAKKIIKDIISRNKTPIILGGTGLYITSLIEDYSFNNTKKNENLRAEYEKLAEEKGVNFLYNMLQDKIKNKEDFSHISKYDKKRIIRALEVLENNEIKSDNETKNLYEYICIGLYKDRNIIYEIINKRVDKMISSGLLDEVKLVFKNGSDQNKKAIGYKELFPYLKEESSLDDCIIKLKQSTRNYAKRQLTWMRGMKNLIWIENDMYAKEKICNIFRGENEK